jgi:transcriptional regulator NrdR family protein
MKCSNCGGKVRVTDTVKNSDTNEIYRQRVCLACCDVFYTVESTIKVTPEFINKFHRYHRCFQYRMNKNNK